MSDTPSIGAFAIVPSNDLSAAVPFWERMGFARTGGADNYIIMTGWGCEIHLSSRPGRDRDTARATLGQGLAVSAFPRYVPV